MYTGELSVCSCSAGNQQRDGAVNAVVIVEFIKC